MNTMKLALLFIIIMPIIGNHAHTDVQISLDEHHTSLKELKSDLRELTRANTELTKQLAQLIRENSGLQVLILI